MRVSYQLTRRAGVLAVALAGMMALATPAINVAEAQQPINTTTTVNAVPSTVPSGGPVTLTASVNCPGAAAGPTGTVNFFDTSVTPNAFLGTGTLAGGPPTATTSAVTASFTAPPNTHTVTAVYSGAGDCLPSLGTTTINVTTTTVTLTGTPNPATQLQSVTFTAVVTCTGDGDPTGSVTFTDLTTATVLGTDATGTAGPGTDTRTFTSPAVTFATQGPHSIQAVYTSTNPACGGATGNTTENVIPLGTSTTTVSASPNPTVVGQVTTLTATVTCASGTPSGGNVAFFDGATLLGQVPVNTGSPATVTFMTTFATSGPHVINAVFSGSQTCASSFGSTTVAVSPVGSGNSTTTVSANPANPAFGQPVILTATVSCPTGSPAGGVVTFTDTSNNTTLGTATVVGGPPTGTASITVNGLGSGQHNISAAFGGTANCGASTGTLVLTVGQGQTISGDVFTPVNITTPTTMLPGTRIFNSVTISGAGSLVANGVDIRGNFTATGGTGLRLCGSTVRGQTNISGMNGVIVIGDDGDDGTPACAGNTFRGPVNLTGNVGFLEFSANNVNGAVTVNNNTTTITVPPENATATELEANTITVGLSCSGNVPPPTNDGKPNIVGGPRTGQCSFL